ncbi:acylglycerol kinase, mitochondrial [Drosophila bipectinata]|uniref:acylglycerol kinase, mitochondrial n=1 Tax=Drosophila bipectinata TaxID=42026 RepID=UPI001C898F16|nr:acylglycerol kinase, mitochondrial isoform X1 [Drosophila bipectinata]
MNYLKVIRNNWKKCTFGAVASAYGFHSLKTHIEIENHMRAFATDVQVNCQSDRLKKVLVVMNPVANKKKSEKFFKNYCEPILHLAGYSVEVLRTNQIGHAKSYIEEMATLPDAIVVAGGDGTSSEVVTGLMRRRGNLCPITILPLGRTVQSASKHFNILGVKDFEYVKSLCQALEPMLKDKCKYQSVIRFDVINEEEGADNHLKPIFGLNGFSWGLLENIESTKDKYWYFGPLRHYASAVSRSFADNLSLKTEYVYTPPCPGCVDCISEQREETVAPSGLFTRNIFKYKKNSTGPAKVLVKNENCSNRIQGSIEANQININCTQNEDNFSELESQFISSLKPGWEFIKKIPEITDSNVLPNFVLKSRTIQLYPTGELAADTFYSIDGEEYDARPIKVSVIPNAIKVFC